MLKIPLCALLSVFLLLLSLPLLSNADEPGGSDLTQNARDNATEEAVEQTAEPVSPAPRKAGKSGLGITPFPVIYYTPETSLAIGGGVVLTYRDKDQPAESRPDNLQIMFAYTLNNQFFLNLAPEKYFNEQRGKFFMNIGYLNWPTSFFGIGNASGIDPEEIEEFEETYTDETFMLQPWLTHEVMADLSLGLTLDWKNSNVSDVEPDSILDQGVLTGSEGGIRSGIGPVMTWDTRDNLFSPSRGSWHKAWAWIYRDWMGSDLAYDYYALDLRHYQPMRIDSVLALQGFVALTSGDVPFNEYPTPLMRGLYENVFTDNNMVTIRAEYRFPIKGRWGGAVFGAVGDAFPDATTLEEIDPKIAGGGGLRFALNKKEKINVRLDIGVSRYGVFPYIMLQEAF
ncbi:MAG: hypothetical protein JRD49_08190 [Deltaproteobacteria bacterium]|nr:hypothetical protein [Deltaproteobacteria bacterium]